MRQGLIRHSTRSAQLGQRNRQISETGRKAGLNLSAGCEMGACGVCRVKVLSGEIHLPDDACLSDGEKAEGYALVCVGTVKGPCRIEPAPERT